MRHPTDSCLLCQTRQATQKNSHLVPKFFGQGIFHGTSPRHGVSLQRAGKKRKVQDIIKEDYIFCPICERGLSIFETYSIHSLERLNNLRYFNEFRKIKIGNFEFIECKKIDIRLFNLFIYSIVWRVSASDNHAFLNFKLASNDEEQLRLLIKEFITGSQNQLMDNLDRLKSLPKHSHVLIRPTKKLRPPGFMLSGATVNDWTHQLCLVDYLLIYVTDSEKLGDSLKQIDNNTIDRLTRIGLMEPNSWTKYNTDLLNDWLS
jgi:hypothetical protein